MLSSAVDGAKQWLHANKEVVDNISKKNAKDARRKAMDHSTFKDVKYVDNFLITKLPIISHLARLICWIFPDLRFIKKIPIFRGTFWWLLGSFAFGTIVLCIIAYFVFYVKDPTVPEIILKLSAVIVPSYFAVFCTNQYMNHRRLYENYMFKDVALTTMLNLRGQYAEGSSSNTLILEKSLGVIFNEPIMTVSEMKVDRNVLKDIIEILKK